MLRLAATIFKNKRQSTNPNLSTTFQEQKQPQNTSQKLASNLNILTSFLQLSFQRTLQGRYKTCQHPKGSEHARKPMRAPETPNPRRPRPDGTQRGRASFTHHSAAGRDHCLPESGFLNDSIDLRYPDCSTGLLLRPGTPGGARSGANATSPGLQSLSIRPVTTSGSHRVYLSVPPGHPVPSPFPLATDKCPQALRDLHTF